MDQRSDIFSSECLGHRAECALQTSWSSAGHFARSPHSICTLLLFSQLCTLAGSADVLRWTQLTAAAMLFLRGFSWFRSPCSRTRSILWRPCPWAAVARDLLFVVVRPKMRINSTWAQLTVKTLKSSKNSHNSMTSRKLSWVDRPARWTSCSSPRQSQDVLQCRTKFTC